MIGPKWSDSQRYLVIRGCLDYGTRMAEAPENLTLRIVQEAREDLREMREMREEQREQRAMLKDLKNRIDGNTVMLSMLAGTVHDHDQRIEKLESR